MMNTSDGSQAETEARTLPSSAIRDLHSRGWTTDLPYPELAVLGRAALDAARRLFELPAERKSEFVDPTGSGNAGWRLSDRPDRPQEVWQLGGDPGPDLWPAELDSDRLSVLRLRRLCTEIVAELLADVAPRLGLPPTELRSCVSESHSVIRLLHYASTAGGRRFSPHTDLGLATFFAGETAPALELQDESGRWRSVHPDCAVALGEMLAVRAKGGVRAVPHHVRGRTGERWSIAVFAHPEPSYELGMDDMGRAITARDFFERAMSTHVKAE